MKPSNLILSGDKRNILGIYRLLKYTQLRSCDNLGGVNYIFSCVAKKKIKDVRLRSIYTSC
jgi:hypothetical protein